MDFVSQALTNSSHSDGCAFRDAPGVADAEFAEAMQQLFAALGGLASLACVKTPRAEREACINLAALSVRD